ncbi:hypothetical protein MMC16_005543 [Acarospora aff. strigata]|nr:hypothetical protein [Acarospora aff. strigata]
MSTGEQAIWCQAAITTLVQCILLPPLSSEQADQGLLRDLLPHVVHVRNRQSQIRARIEENKKLSKRPWPALSPRFDRRQALESAKFSLVYSQCGLWKEAEQLQLAVKNYICPLLGMEHPTSMRIALALSATYWQQARANEAADLQDEVFQACEKSLGPDHPTTLKVMDTLGTSRSLQGRYQEAEKLHRQAIEGMTKAKGAEHEDTLLAVDHLGAVMLWFFRYEEVK